MDKQSERSRDRYREKIKKEKGKMYAYTRIARQREVEEKDISN